MDICRPPLRAVSPHSSTERVFMSVGYGNRTVTNKYDTKFYSDIILARTYGNITTRLYSDDTVFDRDGIIYNLLSPVPYPDGDGLGYAIDVPTYSNGLSGFSPVMYNTIWYVRGWVGSGG